MQRIKPILPAATLAGTLTSLGLLGLTIQPGSIALLALGSAMIAARR